MPTLRPKPIPAIVAEIQRLSPLLAEISAVLHAATGISRPMRKVLERLVDDGKATVPALAEALDVTRQHVQTVVNDLIDKRLVRAIDNPQHRRSKLIVATDRGEAALKEIRAREAPIGNKLAAELSAADAEVAASALAKLRERLEALASEGVADPQP
jgi:DNA-binding MarR family transcriptional regulator